MHPTALPGPVTDFAMSAADALVALGTELNANHYRAVHLAAVYDDELEWFQQGFASPAAGIARRLQMHHSTAREWVRVGHCLRELPLVNEAFRTNEISYAKARIITRWADPSNEEQMLDLARNRSASRLTTAIARLLADGEESDDVRDQRHHDDRSFSSYTDGDGMVVIRVVLPPSSAKPIVAAVENLVGQIAKMPVDVDPDPDASADACDRRSVVDAEDSVTQCDQDASADAPVAESESLRERLGELRRRWQTGDDGGAMPGLGQQRADAFVVLFCGLGVEITTEVVLHVRGDGNTFDDGTPITTNAIARQLDDSFVRLLIHDAQRRPVNASSRRRHPTTRQKRVVMEMYDHECVDCASTDLTEFDHNRPYWLTHHTVTDELEPRCAPCHRARHRAVA